MELKSGRGDACVVVVVWKEGCDKAQETEKV